MTKFQHEPYNFYNGKITQDQMIVDWRRSLSKALRNHALTVIGLTKHELMSLDFYMDYIVKAGMDDNDSFHKHLLKPKLVEYINLVIEWREHIYDAYDKKGLELPVKIYRLNNIAN